MALLPDPRRRGDITFVFAKSLPYATRLALSVALLGLGMAVQALGYVLPGLLLLLAGTGLSLVRGYGNRLPSRPAERNWNRVTQREFERVLEISRQSKSWDQAGVDITCARGALALLALGALTALVYAHLATLHQERLATLWAMDAAVLLLPHWLVGVRRILTNAPLVVKIRILLRAAGRVQAQAAEAAEVQYLLEIGTTTRGPTPTDAKLLVAVPKAGPDFLGVQMQVNLNRVQGSDFPYFYCVLVARPGFGLTERGRPPRRAGITVEAKRQDDVDVVVIRQTTTRNSGYHTKPGAVDSLCQAAMAQALALTPPA